MDEIDERLKTRKDRKRYRHRKTQVKGERQVEVKVEQERQVKQVKSEKLNLGIQRPQARRINAKLGN